MSKLEGSWTVLSMAWLLLLALFACRLVSLPTIVHRWNVWDCGALFTRAAEVWGDISILVRSDSGGEWIQVNLAKISPQGLAGYRQRIDRVVEEAIRRRKVLNLFPRVCADIAQKYQESEGSAITEIQFVKTNWRSGSAPMSMPQGHWEPPSVSQVPPSQVVTLHQARLIDGRWTEAKMPPLVKPIPRSANPRLQNRPSVQRRVRLISPPRTSPSATNAR